jgi:hypothetical protein
MVVGDLPPCIFCPNPSGSNEHAWPEWLTNEIKRIIGDPGAPMAYVRSAGSSDLMWVEDALESLEVVVTCVCHTCNQKWMKKLEDRVSIYGKPMMNGQHKTLDPRQQVHLARWATKTAIVFECDKTDVAAQDSPRTPRARCIQTKLGKYPPVTTQVFLAHYSGPRLLDRWRYAWTRIGTKEPEHVSLSSFVLGEVLIYVFANPWNRHKRPFSALGSDRMIPLLGRQSGDIDWPPPTPITEDMFVALQAGDWIGLPPGGA